MRKMGMKLALLGGFAGAVLLAGCGNNPYDYGRKWSLTAQEDYYSEQVQAGNPASAASSNIGSSSSVFQTSEQARGTGGAGEADASSDMPRIQGSKQEQEHLWLQQDMRVPYPPPQIDAAMELGTGKPLRVGANGSWVQGTYGVELGSGLASAVHTSGAAFEPEESRTGTQSLPNQPASEGPQSPKGQIGQPPAAKDQ
ncbi:MAG TPA: hypothetical protein VFZ09_50195 [Archangium sp.]|uniref:hypothetical protein n=1 Tax=Archangium sp. TaxID=1872627 RepID=UPI002E2F0DF1|nr:hypothetical protein [Archangium sp.]HEX5754456.1 hypothetical protein [Archangium sp.]